MRTTLAIDDDVIAKARALAHAWRVTLGKAISDLARRGMDLSIGERDGFPVFRMPPGVRPITSEAVRQAQDEP